MTPTQLKQFHEKHDPNSLFFSRNNMKFAGDTMRNFSVCSASGACNGERVELWCLYRRMPVKHDIKNPFYFSKANFKRLHGVTDVIVF